MDNSKLQQIIDEQSITIQRFKDGTALDDNQQQHNNNTDAQTDTVGLLEQAHEETDTVGLLKQAHKQIDTDGLLEHVLAQSNVDQTGEQTDKDDLLEHAMAQANVDPTGEQTDKDGLQEHAAGMAEHTQDKIDDDTKSADSTTDDTRPIEFIDTSDIPTENPVSSSSTVVVDVLQSSKPNAVRKRKRRQIKEYLCHLCDYNAKNRLGNLNKHLARVHGLGTKEVFPCPICDERLSYECLKDHIRHSGKSNKNRNQRHRDVDAKGHDDAMARIKELYGPNRAK